ncbi:MAG: Appr-1-p processing protein [Verrucomicrobia bacterium]|jgi:O-acetyl-ADP-ribose deacetylase (regulator of RNase III)/uncharacterized protein YwgA|nr:Appr-1-p processing protein [Verrucomicrobiota bacterium]
MIQVRIGDLFSSELQTLVNTVNCVGIMGKGIAAIFKKRYPDMFEDYKLRCEREQVRLGEPYLYTDLAGASILNFPTKRHWRASTRLADIEVGLDYFLQHYKTWGIQSIAFPPLGCGNGGLQWGTVGPLMYQKLKGLDISVEIYAPYGTPAAQLKTDFLENQRQQEFLVKGKRPERLRPEWAALVEVLYQLEQQPYASPVGRTIFQKICYILTKLGLDTGFQFERNSYGPFAGEVTSAIGTLANKNWLMERQLGRMTALRVGPAYAKDREAYADALGAYKKKIHKTVDLFSRIKSTDQAEQVATVIFAVQKLKTERKPSEVSEAELFDYILDWKKSWRNEADKQSEVAETIRTLEILDWVRLEYSEQLPVPA